MSVQPRIRACLKLPAAPGNYVRNCNVAVRLSACGIGLALLSACASGGGQVAAGPSTSYYVDHAAGNYTPPGPPTDPWGPYITIAASRFDVPTPWIRQVMRVESGGQQYIDGQLTVSPAGAMGLMQLEPTTYQEMAARYGLGSDPFNPYDNIMAGTAYIHEMYEVYGSPGFLAAYNAGPGRLDSFMTDHTPLPNETTNYVAMIAPRIEGYYPAHRSDADQLALNTLPAGSMSGILPPGYDPDQSPAPDAPPDNPVAPVQMAALAPPSPADTLVYAPPAVSAEVAPPPPPPPTPHFSIIPAAMADTPPPQSQMQAQIVEPGHIGWAIQVGAYRTHANANAALGIAELSAVQMLMHGQPVVVSVEADGRIKYRARVVGLPRDQAVDACVRLSTGPTGCVVLSPDAQS